MELYSLTIPPSWYMSFPAARGASLAAKLELMIMGDASAILYMAPPDPESEILPTKRVLIILGAEPLLYIPPPSLAAVSFTKEEFVTTGLELLRLYRPPP